MQTNYFIPFPIFTTERLMLRQLENSDDVAISSLRSNKQVNMFIEQRQKETTVEEAQKFIAKINKGISENANVLWAITGKEDEKLMGTICLWNFSDDKKTAELGYELFPEFHRKGIMNEAFQPIIDFAFSVLKLTKIEAFTHRENIHSISLLIKNNFQLEENRSDEDNENNIIFALTEKIISQ
ncbi:MAG: GNAT family N-acetyltransferase [Bacteroidia bacterium]